MDSGESHHLMGSCNIFTSIANENEDVHVNLGDNTMHAVEGIVNIQFQLDSGSLMEVKEAMYVPSLEKQLLSVSAMEDK